MRRIMVTGWALAWTFTTGYGWLQNLRGLSFMIPLTSRLHSLLLRIQHYKGIFQIIMQQFIATEMEWCGLDSGYAKEFTRYFLFHRLQGIIGLIQNSKIL